MATSTSSIYINVIEDVINKLRDEFVDNGPGEDVLKELQGVILDPPNLEISCYSSLSHTLSFSTELNIFLFFFNLFQGID